MPNLRLVYSFRDITRTPWSSFSKAETSAKTFGRNALKIMDSSGAQPYKTRPGAKLACCHGAAHSGRTI